MKYSAIMLAMAASFSLASCDNADGDTTSADSTTMTTTEMTENPPAANAGYYDLRTGSAVTRDEASGRYMDESGNDVDFYIDAQSHDTFHSASGQNVNNSLIHEGDDWRIDESRLQVDGDNNAKQKTPDGKVKLEDNKVKVKTDDAKYKAVDRDEDGSIKTKTKEK